MKALYPAATHPFLFASLVNLSIPIPHNALGEVMNLLKAKSTLSLFLLFPFIPCFSSNSNLSIVADFM